MATNKRVLIAGANGQLGWELQRIAPENCSLFAVDFDKLDITRHSAVMSCVKDFRPDLIINAAAYTAVDKAEQEREQAYAVNTSGAAHLAEAAVACNSRLIHISTDFVFDGNQSHPYRSEDAPRPLSVYGASKHEGEQRVIQIAGNQAVIIRTSWVYSSHGNNFVKTMLRLMAERPQLGVVSDQIGTPTWAKGLAEAVWQFAVLEHIAGIYHWTDAGVASWYDFAVAIQEEALERGLLPCPIPIHPITSAEYPTPAQRPAFSVLDKSATWGVISPAVHWRCALREMLDQLPK